LNFAEIVELKTIDSFHYCLNNKQIANQFPDIPIFTSRSEIPQPNETELNKIRIKKIIDKFINKTFTEL